jgi:uroporphyrinogen-III synthase
MGTTVRNRIATLTDIVCAIGGDTADILARRGLAEQFWQDRSIANLVPSDLGFPNLQCPLVDPKVAL